MAGGLREVAVGAADGHVEDEVEWLIEWRVGIASLGPWVVESAVVDNVGAEVASIPHIFISKLDEKNLLRYIRLWMLQ